MPQPEPSHPSIPALVALLWLPCTHFWPLDQRQRAIKTSLLRCQLGLRPVNKAPSSSHFLLQLQAGEE